jgi:HK97 family phage portal protein
MGMGSYTDSNELVNEHTALQVPSVLACVKILADGLSQLPMRVYEELGRGRKPAKDHYLYYLLTQRPNPEMSAVTFLNVMMTHAVLWQNAYAEVFRDADGHPYALYPRNPDRTKPWRDPATGVLMFKTTDTPNHAERVIAAKNMLHITGFSLDGLSGSSLVTCARQAIGLSMVAERFAARFYSNGARPGFFLQPDSPLSPEDMALLKEDVEVLSSGTNAWRVGALPTGIKVVPVVTDPSAMQEYINTQKFSREEIAAVFGVPPYRIGASEKTLKSTIEAMSQDFLTTLLPWIERFQQEFQYKLLPPVGRASGKYTVLFYKNALLTIDTATRNAMFTQGRSGGWYTVNNILEQLDMEPIGPEGDTYLRPLNMVDSGSAATEVETDDEPEETEDPDEAKTATRARTLYAPIFKDAFTRLQHRSKQDLATITQTLSPITTGMGAYFRTSNTAGTAEVEAVNRYLKGLESRVSKSDADAEFQRLVKSVVFAVEADAAEARARKVLENE